MLKNFRRGTAFVAAAALSITALAGCSKKQSEEEAASAANAGDKTEAMITLGDQSVSVGAFNFMLRYNMATDWLSAIYRSMYQQDVDVWDYDMYGNGEGYGETVKAQLLEDVEHMMLEQAHMDAYGVVLTDEEKAAITAAAEAFLASNDEEILNNMSATQENVETMLTLRTIQKKMEAAMGEGVDTYVSDEEAAQRDVAYVSFTASTEQETEEETEELSEALAVEEALEESASEAAQDAMELLSEAETIADETAGNALTQEETEVKTGASSETEALEETEVNAEDSVLTEEGTEAADLEIEEETEDALMAAAREEALQAAEAFLASVQGADAEAFENAAHEAEENGQAEHGDWTFGSDDTYPDAAIITATEGLDDGTLVDHVVAVDDTYYVLFVTDAFDEEATAQRKDEIVEERRQDRVDQLLAAWETGSEPETEAEGVAEETTEAGADSAEAEAASVFTVDQEAYAALVFDYLLYQEEETEMDLEEIEEISTEEASEEMLSTEAISELANLQDATETVVVE